MPPKRHRLRQRLTRITAGFFLCAALPIAWPGAGVCAQAEQAQPREKTRGEIRREREQFEKERLAAITLPANPTRAQCEAYVAELRAHADDRTSEQSGHREVAKLKKVPLEHIDLVVREMAGDSGQREFAREAVRGIDLDTHQDIVVDRLRQQPNNIIYVAHYGWFDRARPEIISRLDNMDLTEDEATEAAWFQAFVEVAEPRHYKSLHEIAITSPRIGAFIPLLKTLPDYDVSQTTAAAWEAFDAEDRSFRARMHRLALAKHAAEGGHVGALGFIIQEMLRGREYHANEINEDRLNVTRLIDFRGTDQQIQAWYEQNKDNLVFDNFRKKFVVQEGFE